MARIGRLIGPAMALILIVGLVTTASAEDAKGTIKGSVANKTAGASVIANQDVTLTSYSGTTQKDKKTTKTDAQGSFSFEGLDVGPNLIYQASIEYQGVTYYSQPVMFSADKADQTVTLTVFDSTDDSSVIKSPSKHYLVEPESDGVIISEILIVQNSSDKTYVGAKDVHQGAKETLHLTLPAGAQDVQFVDGFDDSRVFQQDGAITDTDPIFPGNSQRVFRYRIPAQNDAASFTSTMDMGADKVNVLMPDAGAELSVSNLPNKSIQDIQGDKYVLISGEKLAAGTSLEFKMSNLAKAAAALAVADAEAQAAAQAQSGASGAGPASAPRGTSQTLPLFLAGGVAMVVALAAFGVTLRRTRRRGKLQIEEAEEPEEGGEIPSTDAGEQEMDELESERQSLIAAIASLDDAYEQKRIGAEEYSMLRAQQKQQLLEVVARQKKKMAAARSDQ